MNKSSALLSLTGASLIVGTTIVVSRFIAMGKSLYCLQAVSLLIASIILFTAAGGKIIISNYRNTQKKDFLYMFLQTITGVVIFRIFMVYGVKLTAAIDAGVILSFTPVMTVILSLIFLKEKIRKQEIIALVLAFSGVLIINLNGISNTSEAVMRLTGNILIFLAVAGESAFVIYSKKVTKTLHPCFRSLAVCLFGFILMLPMAIYEILKSKTFLSNPGFWLLALYTGAILTAAAYILWFKGIVYVKGITAGIFNTLIPVSSIIFIFIFLKESINIYQGAGLILILSGVAIIILSGVKKKN